jgi:riboflavin synthase
MFTGIIEELGEVVDIRSTAEGGRIVIKARETVDETRRGDSISVNGVCLTVVEATETTLMMDILQETFARSTLSDVSPRDKVNLERSLQPSSRIGGHFVFGHVDCRGKVASAERSGRDWLFRITVTQDLMPFIAVKGSIAVDGISLTVAEVDDAGFSVYIIPHTFDNTTLQFRKAGSEVNIEVDMLARYVQRYLSSAQVKKSELTEEYLRDTGMI